MYLRCTDCYSTTWVQSLDESAENQTLTCRKCGRGFKVSIPGNLSLDSREQYETALALAEGNGLDLPTAYSVMIGIMTLEHATVLRDRGLPAHEAEDSPPPLATVDASPGVDASGSTLDGVSTPSAVEYDPEFKDAVAHGYLSVQQAVERGERKDYAKRLMDRHGLTESLALLVADNKTSLSAALRKDREEVAEILRPVRVAVWKRAFAAGVGGVALIAVGIYSIHVWSGLEQENKKVEKWAETVEAKHKKDRQAEIDSQPAERPPGSVPIRRVRILRDDQGRLVEIEGPDPSSILLAYCANLQPTDRCRPLELTAAIPARPGSKLGVFADEIEQGKRLAIRIRRSYKGSRWIAGDGQRPIATIPAPYSQSDPSRVPILINREPSSDS